MSLQPELKELDTAWGNIHSKYEAKLETAAVANSELYAVRITEGKKNFPVQFEKIRRERVDLQNEVCSAVQCMCS